ncbi:capsule biosynthesis protein [Hoeflea ulvae]|uniref:Capsule biosynthesis protein n=1 Tax=Hoeflea ulvae TaxID=2983764 RepID=A0ABT3YKF8_9HYPH|nr:capsule biosynthesis protein [Hoeflea ulvae]MCY0096386.1 capsule biosynthesis protein [Hoeflea ulvae]
MTKPLDARTQTGQPEVDMAKSAPRGWLSRLGSDRRRQVPPQTIPTLTFDPTVAPVAQAGGKPPRALISFFLMVIIPSLISIFYFTLLASDQFTAEARFAVRSLADDSTEASPGGNLFTMRAASQDSYVVTSFIHSSEILSRLDGKIDYRAIFESPEADFWSRLDPEASREEFLDYWADHVTAYIDGPSSIVTLTVRTFNPDDSVRLATAILEESEKLVNELTIRARDDLLASYRQEVDRTTVQYQQALSDLNRLQKQTGFLSPDDEAKQTGTLLTGLLSQAMELDSRIFVLRQSNGTGSPSYQQLLNARESLTQQIDNLQQRLVGSDDLALTNLITEYSEVETNRIVAEKLFETAKQNYDQAFAAALRKALYLTVFIDPSLPEESFYPRRFVSPLLLSLGFLVFWSLLSLVWASVEDHRL